MKKFHVNKKGAIGLCTAAKGKCPLGDSEQHYEADTLEQANLLNEERLKKEIALESFPKLEKLKELIAKEKEKKDILAATIKEELDVINNKIVSLRKEESEEIARVLTSAPSENFFIPELASKLYDFGWNNSQGSSVFRQEFFRSLGLSYISYSWNLFKNGKHIPVLEIFTLQDLARDPKKFANSFEKLLTVQAELVGDQNPRVKIYVENEDNEDPDVYLLEKVSDKYTLSLEQRYSSNNPIVSGPESNVSPLINFLIKDKY